MTTIWKFPLAIAGNQTIAITNRYDILTVQLQRDQPMLWARVDPES